MIAPIRGRMRTTPTGTRQRSSQGLTHSSDSTREGLGVKPTRNQADLFWSHVNKTDGCWNWTARTDIRGYGRASFRGVSGRPAHRVAWELTIGPIAGGLTVDHLCFNPACVNPAHLQLLPHHENAARQRSALKSHCINGHEFTPENTYIKPGFRNGRRSCRACQREAVRRYKESRKAA